MKKREREEMIRDGRYFVNFFSVRDWMALGELSAVG